MKKERVRVPQGSLPVVPRFIYNPEKAERGLKAMADILAEAIRQTEAREGH